MNDEAKEPAPAEVNYEREKLLLAMRDSANYAAHLEESLRLLERKMNDDDHLKTNHYNIANRVNHATFVTNIVVCIGFVIVTALLLTKLL